jgi:hypothetical protein
MDKYDSFRTTDLETVWLLTPPPQKPTKDSLHTLLWEVFDEYPPIDELTDKVWDLFKDWIKESNG